MASTLGPRESGEVWPEICTLMPDFWWLCRAGVIRIILGRQPKQLNTHRPGTEAVLSEAYHLLGTRGAAPLRTLLQRRAALANFHFNDKLEAILKLLQKYADVPMSIADAGLVRMTETLSDPLLLTTDSDFQVYRCHSRQVIPCVTPS